uniref:Uncharacterized protein n=1 Tax=Paramormyrops kingsleyae TaxID=1676925 RepID=A0A3B3R7X9_9TELE
MRCSLLTTRLEQQNGHLTQVEVDEMLGLMGDVAAKIPPHNAMPGGVILLIKLLGGDVLLDVVLLQGLGRALHGVLLHLLGHVRVFDHRLSVGHGYAAKSARSTFVSWTWGIPAAP